MRLRVAIIPVLLFTLLLVPPQAIAQQQQIDPGNSPAENVRSRGARRPGLMVQAGIARRQNGPDVTLTEPPRPEYRLTFVNELLRNLFSQLNVLIGLLPNILNQSTPAPGFIGGGGTGGVVGASGVSDVVMTEVAHNGNVVFVELLNLGPLRVRFDGWVFASEDSVSRSLPPLSLELNESLVIQLGGERQNSVADALIDFRIQSVTAGELAIYDFSGVADGLIPIEDSNLMVDYIQWNDDPLRQRDPPLEPIAVSANLWNAIDAVPSSLANMTFMLDSGARRRDSTSSNDITIAPFDSNTLGTP